LTINHPAAGEKKPAGVRDATPAIGKFKHEHPKSAAARLQHEN
jgi:hypothetical protein